MNYFEGKRNINPQLKLWNILKTVQFKEVPLLIQQSLVI